MANTAFYVIYTNRPNFRFTRNNYVKHRILHGIRGTDAISRVKLKTAEFHADLPVVDTIINRSATRTCICAYLQKTTNDLQM